MPRFRLLGPLEVRAGDQWQGINARQWRIILAALMVNAGQVVSTGALISEVWGDAAPAKAANLISIYVLRLRRLIGDTDGSVLVTRAPGYQLHPDAAQTDAQMFESLVHHGRRALATSDPEQAASLLTEALALWRGSPLADVPRSALIEAEADRLAELKLDATELRITAELECGAGTQVVAELRRLLADNPLREGLWLLLMRALFSASRQAEALDAYQQARLVIAEELGVNPGAELREFYAEMLAADKTLAIDRETVPALSGAAHRENTAGPAPDQHPAGPAPATPISQPPGNTASRANPQNVTSHEDFARELAKARAQTGLTLEEVAQASRIPPGEAHGYFSGRDLPDLSEDGLKTLRAILAACGIAEPETVIAWTYALIRARPETATATRITAIPAAAAIPDTPGTGLYPDPLTVQTTTEFVKALSRFRVWAGEPSFREMERACRHGVAAATMCTALGSDKLPSLRVVLAIITACGGTQEHQQTFTTAWRKLRMTQDPTAQPGEPPGNRTLYPVRDTNRCRPHSTTRTVPPGHDRRDSDKRLA
jgi:DNA-binding SARP family transcriptional activator/transcriptional regulator with XRE-family HTH domain